MTVQDIIILAVKPNERIDELIAGLTDWRGKTLAGIRRIILVADPKVTEERKRMGTPTWSHSGIVCLANAFKNKAKLTFPEGANLADPSKLFNDGLTGKKWRSIDYSSGDMVKEQELTDLVRSAVAFNLTKKSEKRK